MTERDELAPPGPFEMIGSEAHQETLPKASKYRNVKTEVDGITFHSKAEAKRYEKLRDLRNSGAISDLELQPRFRLDVNGLKICTYVADFSYRDKDGQFVVEDVKGVKTEGYRLKKKLMKAILAIDVQEITR